MIVHPIGMMRADAASSSIADQIIAELGSDLVALYDMTDFTQMYQTTDTSTPVTAAGQNVMRLVDVSGNGHHATADSDASPGNGISGAGFLNMNGSAFQIAGSLTGATTTMEAYLHFNRGTDIVWCLLGKNFSGDHAAGTAWQDNDTATYAGFGGTITDYVDNVAVSPATRDGIFDAVVAAGGYCTQSLRGIDLTGHSNLLIASYSTSALRLEANAKFFLITKALTTTQRNNLHTILGAA